MAGSDVGELSSNSITLGVGETGQITWSMSTPSSIVSNDTTIATLTHTGTSMTGTITITGVSAGATTATVQWGAGQSTITITVTAPTDDESYLNKRGLSHFWENIDDIKQDKLTAGTGISITGNTISATGGGEADSVAWGHITGTLSNQTDLTTALNAKANTADLAAVATSGSYNDLSNKPTIPAKQVFYGTSAASGDSRNKAVVCSGFTYAEGNVIYVTFDNADTYSGDVSMTMNVNSTGAKRIVTEAISGSDIQSDNKWAAGETVCFVCNNDRYLMVEASRATTTVAGLMSPADKTKLNSIAAGAEVNVQPDWTQTTTTADDYIKNKPALAVVATSGSYNDLSNKPTIPAAQVQADWSQSTSTAVDYIKNKPSLATVATSGSYNDLSDKPAIPTVNNATLTIQKNGTTVATFTANSSTATTADITVPTVDTTLSSTSTNPVQNKAIYAAIGDVESILQTLNSGSGAS